MAFVTRYDPGAPCWFELGTTDQNSAKSFYTKLFGWSVKDFPTGPSGVYSMFQLDGHDVGATYTLDAEMRKQSVPAQWTVYFNTADVDAVTTKVSTLGGAIVKPAFDVMDVGRMSVCKDPGDAVFLLWQKKLHPGASVIDQNGAVCWVELATWDVPKARDFYSNLLGWTTKPSANMPTYVEYSVAGKPSGGLLPMDEHWKGIPSHWAIYFMVEDCDASVAKAKELGGGLRVPPFDAPGVGRMAVITDLEGAGFYVIKLDNPPKA